MTDPTPFEPPQHLGAADRVSQAIEAARVLARSLIAILTAVAMALTAFAGEIVEVVPEGPGRTAAHVALVVAAWLVDAVALVRRHAKVPAAAFGITEPAGVTITRTPTVLHIARRGPRSHP